MIDREQIVEDWREKLQRAERSIEEDRSLNRWRTSLLAKVLRYLVERYEDGRCWHPATDKLPNLSDASPPSATTAYEQFAAGVPALAGAQSCCLKAGLQLKWRPKLAAEIRPALDDIRQLNETSYHEFGLIPGAEINGIQPAPKNTV